MDKCCSSRLENEQYSEVGDDGRKHEDNNALIENTNKSLVSGKERMEGDSRRCSSWTSKPEHYSIKVTRKTK
jgi:hypothetical protein